MTRAVMTRALMTRSRFYGLAIVLTLTLATGCDALRIRKATNEGHRLFNEKKFEESVKAYEKIREIEPNNWTANYQIAMAYLALYHPGSLHPIDQEYKVKATELFEKLLTMQAPDEATAGRTREYYVALLNSSDQFQKAIDYYEKFLEQNPKDTKAIESLAVLYHDKLRQFTPGMKYFEQLAELEPTKEHWYIVGHHYWQRSKTGADEGTISIEERQNCIEHGFVALDKALAVEPEYFDAMIYKSLLWRQRQQVLQTLDDLVGAKAAYQTAEELKKKAIEIRNRQQAQQQKPAA